MVKKTLFALFIAALLISPLLGCSGDETTPAAIELVPEKVNMIGSIDLSQIMEDEDIAELWQVIPLEPDMPPTLDEALDMAAEESGLDLRDFREGLIFGDISEATADIDYFGIIVKGTFEENELIASMESERDEPFTTIEYQGYVLHTDPYEGMALAFLGSDALVIGSTEAVKDVIAVRKGDQSAVSGNLLSTYNGLGDALMKAVMIVPPGAVAEGLQEFTGEVPIPLPGLDELADLDTVGMTLAKDGQLISLASRMCFTSSESAEAVESLISLAPMMIEVLQEAPGEMPIPQEAQELLQELPLELFEKLEMDTADSCLTVSLELTSADIEDLLAG